MLEIERKNNFIKVISKIKNNSIKEKIKKQIEKIIGNPEIGKPMRYRRKDTRELYVSPYRIAYAYLPNESKLVFLDTYHKDEQ